MGTIKPMGDANVLHGNEDGNGSNDMNANERNEVDKCVQNLIADQAAPAAWRRSDVVTVLRDVQRLRQPSRSCWKTCVVPWHPRVPVTAQQQTRGRQTNGATEHEVP